MENNRILVFDTTLRDGEQSPGASLAVSEKLTIAHQLARLNVDIIEAGFPVSSDAQFEAVKIISKEINGPTICGLARCIDIDIDRAAASLEHAQKPRIHTFIATSKIHMEKKFQKSENEILEMAVNGVKRAKQYFDDIEFSPEDSARTGKEFLFKIIETAISAGATTINVPDTVGYSTPNEFGRLIAEIFERVPNMKDAVLSVHCHNDLGLAVANTLSAIENGAQQIEVTVNGVGERAGNASLEEVAMALQTRNNFYNKTTNIKTQEIISSSRMVSNLMGMPVQPNKAIVGANAFAHEAGIHQDAVLKHASTYEIMSPADVGLESNKIVLGRHSGRHGLLKRLEEIGYHLTKEEVSHIYDRFLEIADKKKEVFDEDIAALVVEESHGTIETFHLEYFTTLSGNKTVPTATVGLKKENIVTQEASVGDGPIDAAYRAIEKIVGQKYTLEDYSIRGVTSGKDAMGQVVVHISTDGKRVVGRAASTDVIEASIRAYVNAINRSIALSNQN
jgi:2-isopropylmalate synthase